MLEILFDLTTNEIHGWCADPSQFNNFTPSDNEAVITLPIDLPDFPSDTFFLDVENALILPNPDYIQPQEEADAIKAETLLESSPDVISQPEMWELMRIYGRRLGYQF